ncbi:hypothetical protein ACWCOW_35225 [Streptomyces sp. NPDC001939]
MKPAAKTEVSAQTQAAQDAAEALLADARAQADGIFAAARDESSNIISQANQQHDKLMAEAKRAGEELHRKATAEVGQLVADARDRAQRLRVDAEGAAGEVQGQAELAAQRTESAAQGRADAVHRAASEDANKLVEDARARARSVSSDAINEAHRIVQEAKGEADRLLAEARGEAEKSRGVVEKARADAAHIVEEGKGLRARTLASADRQAREIREAAIAETAKKEQRDDALDTWSARLVIAGAVGLTASGEFELARMVGFDAKVAWLLPLVIDVYVVQAFRRHRDILQAIFLTIAANVVFHLADKGLFGVEKVARDGHEPKWWLIALVASVASLILWRMHLITSPPREPKKVGGERQNDVPQDDNSAGQKQAPPATEAPTETTATGAAESTTSVAVTERQEAPSAAARTRREPAAKTPTTGARKPPAKKRQKAAPAKAPRRSMSEWVELTEPIFHAEFKRLKRNPTASEFADAIEKADHGRPSDSTAKSIRTEILDRAPLPSLDTE